MIVSTIVFTYIPIHESIQSRTFALNTDLNIKHTLINDINQLDGKRRVLIEGISVEIEKAQMDQYIKYCGVWLWKNRHERRVCIYDIEA